MSKRISYIRPPKIYRSLLAIFDGVSEEVYSTTLPVKIAEIQENLSEQNGALVQTMKLNKVQVKKFNTASHKAYRLLAVHYKKNQEDMPPTMLLGSSDGTVLVKTVNSEVVMTQDAIVFPTSNYMNFQLEGVSYIIMPDSENNLISYDGETFEYHSIGHSFEHVINHDMRAFASKKGESVLYFSDDFDPYNWKTSIEEGGYINMSGENGDITDILSINQSLIVVQERGMSKVSAFTDQSEFIVKCINIENDIIPNSVVSAVDRLIYCSSMGIGLFNGYESKIYCRELASKLKGKKINGTYLDGKCYFNLYDDSATGGVEILVIDISTMKYHFIAHETGNNIATIRNGANKNIITYYSSDDILQEDKNYIYYLSSNTAPSNMLWRSGDIDFGKSGVYKVIKNIIFGGESKILFRIICDGESYSYNVGEERRVLVNLRGREFQFEMKPQGHKIKVPSPIIEYQLIETIL